MNGSLSAAPIFLVGQPRSGSTLLTRVLNEWSELFVINDFYVLQQIDAADLWRALTGAEARQVAEWIYERIHLRATFEPGKTINQSIDLNEEQLAQISAVARQEWREGLLWSDVLAEVMQAAARAGGHQRWGYNTPQDHLHLDRLLAGFPDARVIFLLREPAGLLRSYKNASVWHDARGYNPTALGIAWGAAAHSYLRLCDARPDQVLLLSFEDLVRRTDDTLRRLSDFLRIPQRPVDIGAFDRNTSYGDGSANLPVTDTEVWLATRSIRAELEALDFPVPAARFRWRDVRFLPAIYAKGLGFYLKAVLTDPDLRKRVIRLLQSRRPAVIQAKAMQP